MASLVESLSQFLIYIGLGLVFFFPAVSLKETGVGFGKLILSVCFGSILTAVLIWTISSLEVPSFSLLSVLGGASFLIVLNYFLLDKTQEPRGINTIIFIIFGFLSLLAVIFYKQLSVESLFIFLSFLFVGCTTFAMLLGHYYLVVPKLSERPLIILHYLLWGIMGAKALLSIYSYFGIESGQTDMWDMVYISMRVLWGYLAIGVLSYFSFRLSKMRSTQSATGVLYVIVFFMIVGELASYYLYNSKGLLI